MQHIHSDPDFQFLDPRRPSCRASRDDQSPLVRLEPIGILAPVRRAHLLDTPLPLLDFSTGAFAVLAALYAGASEVRLVGFSLTSKGHSYNGNERYRNHVSSDAALYALLSAKGYGIVSDVPEIAMICRRIVE